MKRTRIIATDSSNFPWYQVLAWNAEGQHTWDQVGYERGRLDAERAAQEWEQANPPANEGKRVYVLASYPDRAYGIAEQARFEAWEQIGDFPNSPGGWDKARALRQYRLDNFYACYGGAATPPHITLELSNK